MATSNSTGTKVDQIVKMDRSENPRIPAYAAARLKILPRNMATEMMLERINISKLLAPEAPDGQSRKDDDPPGRRDDG